MVKSDVQVEKIATQIARLHICVFLKAPFLQVPPACHHTPPGAQCCPGSRPEPQPHACVSPHSAASFAQPWASFISDWPIMVTPSNGVTYMH